VSATEGETNFLHMAQCEDMILKTISRAQIHDLRSHPSGHLVMFRWCCL